MEQIKKKQRSEKDFKRLSKEEKEMAREIKGKLPRAAKKKQKDREEVEEKPQKNKNWVHFHPVFMISSDLL